MGIGALVLITTVIATTASKTQKAQSERNAVGSELEITVQQLPQENGVTPIELRCGLEDRNTAGPNKAGSRLVNDIRLGAGRYKDWLARQHELSGGSSGALARLLEKNPSPEELGIQNGLQEQGVMFYKDYARKITKETA